MSCQPHYDPGPSFSPLGRRQPSLLPDSRNVCEILMVNSLCATPKPKSCRSPQPFRGAMASPRCQKRDTKIFPCSCTVMGIFQDSLQCSELSSDWQLAAALSKARLDQKEQVRGLGAFTPGSCILVYSQTWQDAPVHHYLTSVSGFCLWPLSL